MAGRFSYAVVLLAVICLAVFAVSCGDDSSTGPESTGFSVSGRAVDTSGNGIIGVSVTIPGKSTVTDSTGHFSIEGLENGTYTLSCVKEGFTFEPSSKQFTISGSSLELASVTGTAIPDTYTVTGLIVGPDDEGVAGVLVQLSGNDALESTVTDSTGAYTFSGLETGGYIITPLKEGYSFNVASREAIVADADVTVQTMRVTSILHNITGRVVDENGGGVYGVAVTVSGGGMEQTVTTNQFGSYSFEGAFGTTYSLLFEKAEYNFSPSSIDVTVSGSDVTVDDVTASEWSGGPGDLPAELALVTIPAVSDPYEMSPWGFSVTLSAYEMSTTEVTNAQYAQYLTQALASGNIVASSSSVKGASGGRSAQEYLDLDASGCQISYTGGSFTVDSGLENRPVVQVTWYGAKAFAAYYGLDLPTEAEWQYAASGGMNYTYGTDDGTIDGSKANYANNLGHATDVGSYPANPFGLYDMAGNVVEWCHDWLGSYPSGIRRNYTGSSSGSERVNRGGYWYTGSGACRVAYRGGSDPDRGYGAIGFRVVRRSSPLQ